MRTGLLLPLLLGAGWRGDGTARWPEATPPARWAPDAPTWKTALGSWGNASPVLVAGRVCTTAEPTTVLCVDAATGQLLWNASNDRIDTLPAAEAAAARTRLASRPDVERQLTEARQEVGALRRALRSVDAPADTAARLAAADDRLARLHDTLAELDAWTTPEVLGLIGYASATPATDGASLYVAFGNGVVSAFSPEGRRRWSRWLGPAVRPMRGYDHGSATSPQLVEGTLVVGHGALHGLDPATGAVRWRDPEPWNHYGTPGLARVDGALVLLLPDGRVLRPRDGHVLATGLGDLYFTGPVGDGDVALWIGGKGHDGDPGSNRATAWRLAPDGPDRVRATRLWDREVPGRQRVYTTPLVVQDRVWVLTTDDRLSALSLATGAALDDLALPPLLKPIHGYGTAAYGQPTMAGELLFLGWQPGLVAALSLGGGPQVVATTTLPEGSRSTPVFEGRTVWMRTLGHLWRFDAR